MNRKNSLLFFLLFSLCQVYGQKRILVKYADSIRMTKANGDWIFRDDLPDGHYISSFTNDSNNIAKEIIVSDNMKKRVYYDYDYEDPKVIYHMFTFKYKELDGPFIVNCIGGARNYRGYFKNGFPDSVWTYCSTHKSKCWKDTSNYWKQKEILYKNGNRY